MFKFGDRSILDLASDLSAWTWLDGAGGENNAAKTQSYLLDIVKSGIDDAQKGRAEFDNFRKIVSDPTWNGILFLNVPFNLQELPAQLAGLAAGINASEFFVHHVGINVSPVLNQSGQLSLQNSTLFGLINYESLADINYTGKDYDFKVQRLSVLFENSHVQTFNSIVQLQLNKLFGEASTLRYADYGNNIVLNGAYQRHDASASYVFVQNEPNVFLMESFVLAEIDIERLQFFTVIDDTTAASSGSVSSNVDTRFVFSGQIRFNALDNFDVFSYGLAEGFEGGLYFSNLSLTMSFDSRAPKTRTFAFSADDININSNQSLVRPTSLANHFPLVFDTFVQGSLANSPGDLGYMAVSSPLDQGQMDDLWYGLVFDLDLGTLGALAASAGLKVSLMAAWSTTGTSQNVYIGLKLPGSASSQTRIPIEGMLNLNFKQIELVTVSPENMLPDLAPLSEIIAAREHASSGLSQSLVLNDLIEFSSPAPDGTSYMLKFRGVSFNFLTLAFPPGDIEVYLFGNPANGDASLLGWYAGYVNEE